MEWSQEARQVALRVGFFKGVFSSEDVTDIVGLPNVESVANANNAVGSVFSGLARSGLIQRHSFTKSRSLQGHNRLLATWTLTAEGETVAEKMLGAP